MQPRSHLTDRRVQKTRKVLNEALHSLIREKSYDSIVVREILDRANVGRSTFYTHYHDKDDLLASGIRGIIDPVRTTSAASARDERILSFSLPIFEHLERHRRSGNAKMGVKDQAALHQRLRKMLVELIAEDVGRDSRVAGHGPATIPRDLLVRYVTSTFVLVLNWWVESRNQLSASEVNDLFRGLVMPALAGIS